MAISLHRESYLEYITSSDGKKHYFNAEYLDGRSYTDITSLIDKKADSSSLATVAKTGSYNDLNNKPDVVTYSKSGSTHYLYAFGGGRYKITAPAIRKSDGTYEDVEILTTTNIATQGLFVPMTGTGTTPITSDLYMKGRYDRTISSSGLVPEGGGSVSSKPTYSEAYYGLKGICYSYYSDDSTYGATSDASSITNYQGFCYNPLDGTTQRYNQFQIYTPFGLSVYRWIAQNGRGPNDNSMDWSSFRCSTIDSNGSLIYYDGSTHYTKKIENLVQKTEIKTINGDSLLGSGDLVVGNIVSDTNTTGYFSYDSSDWAKWQLKTSTGVKHIRIYLTSIKIGGGNNSLTAVTFRDTWEKVPAVFVQEKTSPSMNVGSTYRNGLQVQDITKTGCNIRNNKSEIIYANVMVIGW